MDINLWKLWETVNNREACHAALHGLQTVRHNIATEQRNCLSDIVLQWLLDVVYTALILLFPTLEDDLVQISHILLFSLVPQGKF